MAPPRPRRSTRAAGLCTLALVCAPVLGACTTAGPSQTGVAEGSLGVLSVERTAGEGRASLGASFSRYRGVDADTVLRLVGGGRALEAGCVAGGDVRADAAAGEAEIEMVDVGAIRIQVDSTDASAATSAVELSPRTFPAVGDLLAGVFYAGEAELPPAELSRAYTFSAAGNGEIGPFEVMVPAIVSPASVRVDGVSAEGAWLLRGRDVEVSWSAEGGAAVEVEVTSGDGATLATCAGSDDGTLRVPGTLLAHLSGSTARLVVRRLLVSSFDVTGLDRAQVRVSAARAFNVAVR